jgi:hypothetical protein
MCTFTIPELVVPMMETDDKLEQKQTLDKVRFSIRNCKTETTGSDEAS